MGIDEEKKMPDIVLCCPPPPKKNDFLDPRLRTVWDAVFGELKF